MQNDANMMYEWKMECIGTSTGGHKGGQVGAAAPPKFSKHKILYVFLLNLKVWPLQILDKNMLWGAIIYKKLKVL